MNAFKTVILLILTVVAMAACQSDEGKAEHLMAEIRTDFDAQNYEACLKGIDSLRATFPKAIEARREALELYKEASLRIAQRHLAELDQQVMRAEAQCDSMTAVVELRKSEGNVTADELQRLNLLRVQRDSLKGAFDVECSKIKYIHKKQKE